jgi:hypothetical protein
VWTFRHRRYGVEIYDDLTLTWEAAGDPVSGDFDPAETDADAVLKHWLRSQRAAHRTLVKISWSVIGLTTSTSEAAPFTARHHGAEETDDFLSVFTWPENDAGERLNWLTLPVVDKQWRRGQADKGGFLQAATGWKPAPLQPELHLAMFDGSP